MDHKELQLTHFISIAKKEDVELIVTFIDTFYRKDYFLPKKNVTRMVTGEVDERFGKARQPIYIWVSKDNEGISGVAFVTRSKTLIQLLIRPDCRKCGLGSYLLSIAAPEKIRCKTDVVTGDPTGFYMKNGYVGYQKTLDGTPAKTGKKNNILLLDVKKDVIRQQR